MITQSQVDLAKALWEQGKESAQHAHESWRLFMQSHKMLLDSYRAAGFPLTQASEQFDKLMEEHTSRHKAAMEHMDSMAKTYAELLEQFKKADA
jgi:hypothetical protein